MNRKNLFLLTLLLSAVIVLAACAPEPTPETAPIEPQNPPQPEPTEPVAYPYPYPDMDYQDPQPEAYPAPEEASDNNLVYPYPGVADDAVGADSDELVLTDFTILPSDKALQPGPVYIEETGLVMKESFPVQVELVVTGNLPTPCHQLRVFTAEPDADGHIRIEAYSVSDPEKMCAQVLKPFVATIPLGEFTKGEFTYLINDEFDGAFELP